MLFTITCSNLNSQWILQTSGTNNDLYSVYFANNYTGWVAGDNGTIIKSTNSGANWNNQVSGTNNILMSVRFFNSTTGWVVGDSGTILRTTNGGIDWNFCLSGTINILRAVYFVNSQTGWIVGDSGTVLKTTDGGDDWSFQSGVSSNKLNSVYFIDGNTGWISCAGAIYKTTDSGNNWIWLTNYTKDLVSIFFINENTGWVTGSVYTILKSTDGGMNWSNLSLSSPTDKGDSPPAVYTSVYFINENTGWFTSSHSFGGAIHKTTNGGFNWTTDFPTTQNEKLYSICFSNPGYGWAVGEAGTVLANTTVNETSINKFNNVVDKFYLSQNYPNPFNPATNIKYSIIKNGLVVLKVFDNLGRNIATLVNEKQNAGTYEINFNAGNLPSGIYFYKLQSGDFTDTKKMLVVK